MTTTAGPPVLARVFRVEALARGVRRVRSGLVAVRRHKALARPSPTKAGEPFSDGTFFTDGTGWV